MAPRLLPLVLLLLLLPASASVAAPRSAAAVKVIECDAATATATFESIMRTVPGASQLSVRFVLEARTPGQRWLSVRAPGFGRWLSARAGRTRFVYDKTLEGLTPATEYRVQVAFRWRDANGRTTDRTRRRSPVCSQPDPRPDLRPVALEPTPTGWVLTVVNAGGEPTTPTDATLDVGGTLLRRPLAPLAAGTDAGVYFDGVSCLPGETLTATVDAAGTVAESDETGNVLSLPCPRAS